VGQAKELNSILVILNKVQLIKLGIMFVFYIIYGFFFIRGWGLLMFVLVIFGVILILRL